MRKVLDVGAGYCYFINNINCKEKHALDISEAPFSYYYKGDIRKIRLFNNPSSKDKIFGYIAGGSPKTDFTEVINNTDRIWLILAHNFTDGAGDFYETLFNIQRKKIKEKRFKGIRMLLFVKKSNVNN